MPFSANPGNSGFHQESWQDYYIKDNRYHKQSTPIITQGGGPEFGDTPNSTRSFDGVYIVYERYAPKRLAEWLIRLRCSFMSSGNQECIGLQFFANGNWMDFSVDGANVRNSDGVTNWGDNGQQMRNWYNNKHFARLYFCHIGGISVKQNIFEFLKSKTNIIGIDLLLEVVEILETVKQVVLSL